MRYRQSATLFGSIVLIAACTQTGSRPAARQQDARQLAAMSFKWPASSVVHVTEKVDKKGVKAETAYELHICPAERGLKVHYRNFRITKIRDVSANDPRVRDQIASAAAFARLIPVLWVDTDGRLLDSIGMEKIISDMNDTLPDEAKATMERMLADPKMMAMLKARSSEVWSAWVAAWALFEPNGDAVQAFVTEFPMPRGTVERRHEVERVQTQGRLLHLRLAKTEGNKELKAALIQIMRPLLANAPDPAAAQAMLDAASITRHTKWEALTDPSTLRPEHVETTVTMKLSMPGEPTKTRFEFHRYDFDWATGAKTTPQCPAATQR